MAAVKKEFKIDLFAHGSEIVFMYMNRICLGIVQSIKVEFYKDGGGIEYLIAWEDPEDGENLMEWKNGIYIFENRETLLAQL